MSLQTIHPQPVVNTSSSPASENSLYEIAASGALPVVDPGRSIYSEWLRGGAKQRYVRFTKRWKAVILWVYVLGYLAFWVVLFAPARVGRWLALAASVPTNLTCAVYFMLLRFDIVALVVHTYEFWFFSVANAIAAVLLAAYLNDTRAIIALPIWLTLQNNILTDANTVFTRIYLTTCMAMLLFVICLIMAVLLDLVDNTHTFELLWIDTNRRLLVQDALIHSYSTQAIVLARNMYRRWTSPTEPRSSPLNSRTIICVTLRARVKLRLVGDGNGGNIDVLPRDDEPTLTQADGSILVRLKLVPVKAQFRAGMVIAPPVRGMLFQASAVKTKSIRTSLLAFAYTGLLLCIYIALRPSAPHANKIRVVSFACSVVFVGCLASAPQRQLLRRLVFTFDFAFLSIQLLVVHACLCDMLGWGYASLPVITIWLWIQWVLTSDAITPVVKLKWGIRRRLPTIIMIVYIVSQIVVFVVVLTEDTIRLRNRVLLSVTLHGRRLELRVIPTLLSRLVLLFLWSWKVLWRMWTIRPDELLMIQGSMTYANPRHECKPPEAIAPAEISHEKMIE